MTRDEVVAAIEAAFAPTERPGAAFLQGSHEGCEPFEETSPFADREWQSLDAGFLDAHYSALSFFSEGAFRYYLPAFLVADLRDELNTADPVFHLTHGFSTRSTHVPAGGETFERCYGGDTLLNPRRYGAMTSRDHGRFRLSVFTREEAAAIVAYLEYMRASEPDAFSAPDISAALDQFWYERARTAVTHAELRAHVEREQRYVDAILRNNQR
jgi:hypothetical protein